MPFKHEFGESPKLKDGLMYLQDFSRLKAILFNNVATCYFNMDEIVKSEQFNDLSTVEDPDYAKGMLRKILIMERKG